MDRLGVLIEACSRGKSRLRRRDGSTERPQGCGSHRPPSRQEKPL